ncbi:hypothetical protein [Bacillus sp. FJAT-45350]|uniref:hypothetical protein n=1 Tax=Bacillus sp. FJAT-45350 TaxID=2011014 RepID=UPI000BB885AE|nr:hypothetical protein [Bacillus sp. FJAT-45350]
MRRGSLGQQTLDNINRKKAGLVLLADNLGKNMEGMAKKSAPWKDRNASSGARGALHGGGELRPFGASIYLAHGKHYGAFLEDGTGIHGPFNRPYRATVFGKVNILHPGMRARPIIRPTTDSYWPTIKRNMREYWRK